MQADFSVELGGDAPALEIPWRSDDSHVRYFDLKKHPELVLQIPEAVAYPDLGSFLSRINAAGFPLATAKCDAWPSSEVAPEEEVLGDRKFVSYIDLIFTDERDRCSLEKNEAFAKELCQLLGHAPEIAATVELVIRHCYCHQEQFVSDNGAEPSGPRVAIAREPGMSSPENEDDFADVTEGDEHGREPLGKGGNTQLERKDHWDMPKASSVTGFCLTAYVSGFGDSDHDAVRQWTIGLNLLQHAIIQLSSNSQPNQ